MSATPSTGMAPLTVTFDGSAVDRPRRHGDIVGMVIRRWRLRNGISDKSPVHDSRYLHGLADGHGQRGASGATTRSIVVTALPPPNAPTNLTATALTGSAIRLKWTNGTTNQTQVRIERCKGSRCTNFVQVSTVPGTATTFTDSGLATLTVYTYRVRAHNAGGDSSYSNTASARTRR